MKPTYEMPKRVATQVAIDAITRGTDDCDRHRDIVWAAPKIDARLDVFQVRFEDGFEATYWLRAGKAVRQ